MAEAPSSPTTAVRDIEATLDAWHAAAARSDEDQYFAAFAEGGVFLGTDATERWSVEEFRAYAHPHFAKGKGWELRPVRRDVTVHDGGSVAWFDEDLDSDHLGPLRGSGVMLRSQAKWKVAQYNLAFTVPNDHADAVVALLEENPRQAESAK